MGTTRETTGHVVRRLGWVIVGLSLAYTAYGYLDIYSDISVRAYAPLIVIEGGFYTLCGFAVVWAGRLIRGKGKPASESAEL